jgi:hypothetical protein
MKRWQTAIIIVLGVLSMIGAFFSGASKNYQYLFTGLMILPLIVGFFLLFHFLAECDKRLSSQPQANPIMTFVCPFCYKDVVSKPYIKIDSFIKAHRDCIEEEIKNSRIIELVGLE